MWCFGVLSPSQALGGLGPPPANPLAALQATHRGDASGRPLGQAQGSIDHSAGLTACDSVQDQSQVQLMAHNLIKEIISGS